MGAGAGYSIKSTVTLNSIQSLKLDNIVEAYTVEDGLINFIAVFDCSIDCTVDDLEFESYSAGGKIEDIVQGTMTKIRLQFENAEVGSESQSDIAEWIERNQYKIRENLRNTRIGTDYLVGAGWIHQTFTGAITDLDDLDAIENEYYYANDWSLFIEAAKILVESNVAEYIDKAVTGDTVTTTFYVEDEEFTELEAAKEYAIDNGYDRVMAYVDEEDFDGNFNTIDSYVAWRDEPVDDEFDDSLDEGIADMAATAVNNLASRARDAASRFAGKVSDTIDRVRKGETGFQKGAKAWTDGLDKIGDNLMGKAFKAAGMEDANQIYDASARVSGEPRKQFRVKPGAFKDWKTADDYRASKVKNKPGTDTDDKSTSTDKTASAGGAKTTNTGTNTNSGSNSGGSDNTGSQTNTNTGGSAKTYTYFTADDTPETAKQKYRQHAKTLHPDMPGGDKAKFQAMDAEFRGLFDSYDYRRFREGVERSIKRKVMRMNESKSNINEATTDEFKEIMSLAKQAGFKTAGELFKFKQEHKGEDLLQALRDRVGSNKPEAEAFKVNYKSGNIYASKIIKANSKEAAKKIAEANGIKNIIDVKSMDYAAAERLGFDYIAESIKNEAKEGAQTKELASLIAKGFTEGSDNEKTKRVAAVVDNLSEDDCQSLVDMFKKLVGDIKLNNEARKIAKQNGVEPDNLETIGDVIDFLLNAMESKEVGTAFKVIIKIVFAICFAVGVFVGVDGPIIEIVSAILMMIPSNIILKVLAFPCWLALKGASKFVRGLQSKKRAKQLKEYAEEDDPDIFEDIIDRINLATTPVELLDLEDEIDSLDEDDLTEEGFGFLYDALEAKRDEIVVFDNDSLDEYGADFGLTYMFYKDRDGDVMLYYPDIEDYADEDEYDEMMDNFDDFINFLSDKGADIEDFNEYALVLHRW